MANSLFHLIPLLLSVSRVQLSSCILINVLQVLRNSVIRPKVLFSEVKCLFIAENRSMVGSQELLLDSHVVVGNCKHTDSILGRVLLLPIWSFSNGLFFLALRVNCSTKKVFLKKNDSRHSMVESQFMFIQLAQHSANIEMSIGLRVYL